MLRRSAEALLVAIMCALATGPARAQDVRPGNERPALPPIEEPEAREPRLEIHPPLPDVPAFEPGAPAPGGVLPEVPRSEGEDTEGLEAGVRVQIRAVRITGNTAVPDAELAAVAAPYVGRALAYADVQRLRDDLTRVYVERGFVTSGALVPNQDIRDGVLEIWIVEGVLTSIEVTTDGRLRESYVRKRLERAATVPVDVHALEESLQILQQDERIHSVHAQLAATERRGESVLRVEVVEARPWSVRTAANNYSSPTIGSARTELEASWNNVTGFGDAVFAEYEAGEALQDIRARWSVPLNAYDTRLDFHFRRTWSRVIEDPFDALDIKSKTETYGFRVDQPIYRSLSTRLSGFLVGEWRRSESFLFGDPWSFVPGPDRGTATVSVLRFGGDVTWRSRNRVFAGRSLLSVGIPILGATENDAKDVPDAEFVAWLLQLQWAQRFPRLAGIQLLARADLQLANSPLFGLEQFAIGGHSTVRGYRENRLVRDQGVVGSIELRIPLPLPSWGEWRPGFELAPFLDVGHSWNADREDLGPQTLLSAGIGGRLSLTERLLFEIYWGAAIKDVPHVGNSLQDDGVQLGVRWGM